MQNRLSFPYRRVLYAAILFVAAFALNSSSSVLRAHAAVGDIDNPILFVTQVPIPDDFTTIGSVFGNQSGDMQSVGRGGDLWIRYPDGTLKNLTEAAGYGETGMQGANAIAVRDPYVHWNGNKALFSMVIGAPTAQYQYEAYYWQLYEITGLGKNQTPVVTKIPHQPATYNNITPIYGTDDRIIFTSDRPFNGAAHLYPQRDEYEEAPVVSGLWSLDPDSGDLFLINHSPSGVFTPSIDSYGRLVFVRWDHLQRDQQADSDREQGSGFNSNNCDAYCTFNFADESANAAGLATRDEVYPEPRGGDQVAGTNLWGHTFNDFAPWQINEDGTEEETLNHIGRHELLGYIPPSLNDDPNLYEYYGQYDRFNPNEINNFLQLKEDASSPGRYFGTDAPEFSTHAAGQIISINGAPTTDADHMAITYRTHRDTSSYTDNPSANHSGLYRDPLPLSTGTVVAAHTSETREDDNEGTRENPQSRYDFRIKTLKPLPNGYWGSDQTLTNGISKNISYWDPDVLVSYNGKLWELQPVEVRARTKPARRTPSLPSQEQQAIQNAGVNVDEVQQYLIQNNLALMVSRNVTTRDDQDKQQPYNLKVANSSTQTLGADGKIYTIEYLQLFQGDMLRGLGGIQDPRDGRRVLAQQLHDVAAVAANVFAPSGPESSVLIASDGSIAAFVPARRAMTWQLTDPEGVGVVRERYWITFQPGEIRVCTSCHGLNENDQAGNPAPLNVPQALTDLMEAWNAQHGGKPTATPTVTRTRTATPTKTIAPPTATATATKTIAAPTTTPTVTATKIPCAKKPKAPGIVSPEDGGTVDGKQALLDWNAVNCANKYRVVVRFGSPQGDKVESKRVDAPASQYRTKKLERGNSYVWRVRACNDKGCRASAWSSFALE